MKNVFKIVFLGLIGFGLLVYLTSEQPNNVQASETITSVVSYGSLPKTFELVGKENDVKKSDIFTENKKSLIIVGNHDSLAIVKDLKKHFTITLPFVMVANISNAPWFIKKWAIPGKLEELNKDSNIPMIYDTDGLMVKSLQLDDTTKTKYFVYVVSENGYISLVYTGNVKEGAMDGSMNEAEIKESLKPVIEAIK